jgi:hypothetical protein
MKTRLSTLRAIGSLCISSVLVGCIFIDVPQPRKDADSTVLSNKTLDGGASTSSETLAALDAGKTTSPTDTSWSSDAPVSNARSDGDSTSGGSVDSTSNASTWDHDSTPTTPSETPTTETSSDSSSSTSTDTRTLPEPELCAAGYYRAANAQCVSHTKCGAGKYVVTAGTADKDTVCQSCPTGYFSTQTNAVQCTPHKKCPAGTHFVTAGTDSTDTVCTACPSGTFSSTTNAPQCTPYTTCNTGYYRSGGTNTSDAVCTLHTVCTPGTFRAQVGDSLNDAECVACAGGYTTQNNASQCTPHSPACGSAYDETRAPSQTNDRECACQQTCGDGRCIARDACCNPADSGATFAIPETNNKQESFTFCIDSQRTLRFEGAAWNRGEGGASTVSVSGSVRKGNTPIGSWVWFGGSSQGTQDTYTLSPGTYHLNLEVSSGAGTGRISAELD